MHKDNPYSYEGTAESLVKPCKEEQNVGTPHKEPTVHPPSNTFLVLASLFSALLISSIFYLFIHPLLIIPSWFLAFFVIYPIGEFILEHDRKNCRRTALYRFWIAAIKVTIVILILILGSDFLFGFDSRTLVYLFSIGYGCQTLAASLVLFFMCKRVGFK
jgi:hypothetical protein